MGSSISWEKSVAGSVALLWVLLAAAPASAAEPYELDPVLSLTGNCSTSVFDPVPDPSCSGEPPAYPAPPNGPTGRFDEARAVAIDPFGNEYVASYAESDDAKGRIDVFDDEGHFITEVATPGQRASRLTAKATSTSSKTPAKSSAIPLLNTTAKPVKSNTPTRR